MRYRLIQLAPGSYDLLLGAKIIGSVVRSGSRSNQVTWIAELLQDLPPQQRPAPFTTLEHSFESLEAVCAWLGRPKVTSLRRTA